MENLRGKVTTEYKFGRLLGSFIIFDIVVLITAFTAGAAWRILLWLIPSIGGGC